MSATFRFLPLGHHGVQPYIGAGAGVFAVSLQRERRFSSRAINVTIIHGNFTGSAPRRGPWFSAACGFRLDRSGGAESCGINQRLAACRPIRGSDTHAQDRSRRLDVRVHAELQVLTKNATTAGTGIRLVRNTY